MAQVQIYTRNAHDETPLMLAAVYGKASAAELIAAFARAKAPRGRW